MFWFQNLTHQFPHLPLKREAQHESGWSNINQGTLAWQQLPPQQSLDPYKVCVQKICPVWRVEQDLFVQLSFLCACLLSCNSKEVNGFCLHVILHAYPPPAEQSVKAVPHFYLYFFFSCNFLWPGLESQEIIRFQKDFFVWLGFFPLKSFCDVK